MIRRILPPLSIASHCFALSLLCSLCALSTWPQTQNSRAQDGPQATPGSVRVHADLTPKDHEQFVSYWTTETGWKSELQLRNNLADKDLTVTPALRLPDGTETTLAAVTVKPQEVKSVDLDTAISAAAAPQFVGMYGSLVLRYHSEGDRNLYAALMIRNVGHPFAFHIDAISESQDYQAGGREGIWWLPTDKVNDYLIVTNQGKNTIPFVLSLFDSTGRESKQKYVLGPRETARYSVRAMVQATHISGSYGGIKLSAGAHAGSLDTLHFLFDEGAGFSAILKMFDHDPSSKLEERDFAKTAAWTLRAPMLALTNPDPALVFPVGTVLRPQLFIRNTTNRQVAATLRFNWRDDKQSGSVVGPALKLSQNGTRRLDVAEFQASGLLPKTANWTSVTLTTDSAPDEIVAVAASFDESLRYGAQTPFSDQLSFRWEGGMWEYDPYHSSILSVGNGATKAARVGLSIFYNEGTEKYELEQTLKPDEQRWVDIGKLVREHIPDKNGKTLPPSVTMGSYQFLDLTGPHAGSLFEGKVTYDKTYGHVAYGCATCCGNGAPYLTFDPLDIPFLPGAGNGVWASDNCGGVDNVTSDFTTWSTGNTSIATVNNSGWHTAVSIGPTVTSTSGSLPHTLRYTCPLSPRSTGGGR